MKTNIGTLAVVGLLFLAPFTVVAGPVLQQVSPISTTYTWGVDFGVFTNASGAALGSVTGELGLVNPDIDTGCQAADFAGFASGEIALIRQGGCTLSLKINNAMAAGAIGALIYQNGGSGISDAVLIDPTSIPAFYITLGLGSQFAAYVQTGNSDVTMFIDAAPAQVPEPGTWSLLAVSLMGWFLLRKYRVQ